MAPLRHSTSTNATVGQVISIYDGDWREVLGEHRRCDETGDARAEDHGAIVQF
jgi:hypothetical protein